ncbi:hypothetical protein B0T25DRAFT_17583 [Lasiosphaeria hispida]|uniref:Cx9C motif-containing protein 4, mitochondrial n=1 Tax=Lasiosphaeria hispida TaxID=260671 RepID=A0AAJ0HU77_9PEZI|nr:hypothetical protein B0T25DRAFT_17583 [Lasiosphaeria hispida]
MTLEQDVRSKPPCHPRACAIQGKMTPSQLPFLASPYGFFLFLLRIKRLTGIQDCLSKNGFNEAKCTEFVDSLYECCVAFYERNGDEATTVTCPKANILRLKVEQRKKEVQS